MLEPQSRIAILVKAPVVGEVKTRLSPYLSSEQACVLHKSLFLYLLKQLASQKVDIWASSEDAWLRQQAKEINANFHLQVVGDLGLKMASIADFYLEQSISPILIGSDCPFINQAYISAALKKLHENIDVILGPAEDGGYVLLALNANSVNPPTYHKLFANIEWGSSQVLSQTQELLKSQNYTFKQLQFLADIDRPEDLTKLSQLGDFPEY